MPEFGDFPPAPPPAEQPVVEAVADNTSAPDVVVTSFPLDEPLSPVKLLPFLELSVADLNVQSGTVAVTWCVSPELLKNLAEQGIRDPQVVLVTATADEKRYHVTKEYRVVAPLKDMMAYIEFRSSGTNRVWGFISSSSKKDTRSRFLGRSDGQYKSDILSDSGDEYCYDWVNYYTKQRLQKCADPLTVEVPTGVFASEPSAFEKAWVNYFFKSKSVDQCSFRRRRMLAYTVQTVPFFANWLARLVLTLTALLIGSRGFTLNCLLHPLTYDFDSTIDLFKGGSVFIQETPDHRYYDPVTFFWFLRKYWAVPFMPVIFAALCGILWMILGLHLVLIYALIVLLAIGATVGLGILGFKALNNWLDKRQLELDKLPPWYLEKEEMDLLMCSNPNKPRTLADLPAKKRTFRLHFQDFKSKVCRPFSA